MNINISIPPSPKSTKNANGGGIKNEGSKIDSIQSSEENEESISDDIKILENSGRKNKVESEQVKQMKMNKIS